MIVVIMCFGIIMFGLGFVWGSVWAWDDEDRRSQAKDAKEQG